MFEYEDKLPTVKVNGSGTVLVNFSDNSVQIVWC